MENRRFRLRGLYAVTPEIPDTAELAARVRDVLAGGACLVQYRSKNPDAALRRRQAAALLQLCRERDVPLIINDDAGLAAELGADGVHVGRDDVDLDAARMRLGSARILGASCYNDLERAVAAVARGADYVAFGAAFPSATKPGAARAPLSLYAAARSRLALPIAAIGGITVDNAPQLIAAGVDLLAVISDLFETPDAAARAAAYARLFGNAHTPQPKQ
jgi:thiamine-phosphate pyrophosphorylase